MYKELLYSAFFLGIGVFGTELVSRFKPSIGTLPDQFTNQSGVVLGSSILEILISVYILRCLVIITVFKLKLVALCVVAMSSAAIGLRANYEMFSTVDGNAYNLYNATSFLLCCLTACWLTFLFYKKPIPPQNFPSIPLTDALRRSPQDNFNHLDSDGAVTQSADDYYLQNGHEILPSYYDLPTPPAYTKLHIPDITILQEAHTSRSVPSSVVRPDNNNNANPESQPQSEVPPNRQPTI